MNDLKKDCFDLLAEALKCDDKQQAWNVLHEALKMCPPERETTFYELYFATSITLTWYHMNKGGKKND